MKLKNEAMLAAHQHFEVLSAKTIFGSASC
jgi:hypothetical protein